MFLKCLLLCFAISLSLGVYRGYKSIVANLIVLQISHYTRVRTYSSYMCLFYLFFLPNRTMFQIKVEDFFLICTVRVIMEKLVE
jgi:hypothetical protein